MNSELVNIIKELIGNVTAFLHDDDNSWDDPYEVMRGMIVEDTLNKALADSAAPRLGHRHARGGGRVGRGIRARRWRSRRRPSGRSK